MDLLHDITRSSWGHQRHQYGKIQTFCLHSLVKLPQNRNIQPSGNCPNGFDDWVIHVCHRCVLPSITMPFLIMPLTFFEKMLKTKTEYYFNQMAVCILDVFMCLPLPLMKQWRALAFVSNSHSLVMDLLSGAKIFMILPEMITLCILHLSWFL